MRIQGMPKEERPREKMIFAGKEALSNSELLAILLRAGTKNKSALQIAAEILSQNESGILYLESCSPEELSEIKGVGMAKACQILAAVELGKRIASHPPKVRKEIENPDDIVQLFMGKMRYYKKEHEVSIGDLCSTPVHPREVFCQAIKRSAAAVLFVHNHPSGDPTPSRQDVETTKRLLEAAKILGIRVLDHIIIGDGAYISLRKKGLM